MQTLVGIFPGENQAGQAIQDLLSSGFSPKSVGFLTGENSQAKLAEMPTTDTERDGMGKSMGAFLGAVVGASGGLGLGSALASFVIPGVGPILAAGIGAAAVLGLGGAAAGAHLGEESEHALDLGIPRDDVFFYRDLLKRGRSLVVVNLNSQDEAETAEEIFRRAGAEETDAALQQWRADNPTQFRQAS
ncbi:MAG TPA: hypothetical protein VFA68_17380 [Terriglobales bacterium]|nr:hypothetical protein [Terriglobales bacterium]